MQVCACVGARTGKNARVCAVFACGVKVGLDDSQHNRRDFKNGCDGLGCWWSKEKKKSHVVWFQMCRSLLDDVGLAKLLFRER